MLIQWAEIRNKGGGEMKVQKVVVEEKIISIIHTTRQKF
jgi:hypothetical protein